MKISSYFRNIGIISGATILAQAITILALPILTRIYTTQDFEDFGIFTAFILILSSVISLRFNIAIPLAKDNKEMFALTYLSLFCTVMISVILICIYLLISNYLSIFANIKNEWLIPAIVLGSLGISVYNVFVGLSQYSKDFVIISKSKIARSLTSNLVQITIGLSSYGGGLIVGYLVLCWTGVLVFFKSFKKVISSVLSTPKPLIKKTFYKKIDYVTYSVPEILFFSLGAYLPIILIAAFTQNAEAGFFFLAFKFVAIPMLFLGQSISAVYTAYAPKQKTLDELFRLTKDTVTKLFYFAGIPFILIGISAPFYSAFIFGSDWAQVGYYIGWLTIGSILQLISSPVAISLHITKKIRLAMIIQLVLLFVKIVPLYIALHYEFKFYLEVFAISNTFAYLMFLILIFLNLKKNSFRGL